LSKSDNGEHRPTPRETLLDERPLKITMYVEAVRLIERIERAKTKAAR